MRFQRNSQRRAKDRKSLADSCSLLRMFLQDVMKIDPICGMEVGRDDPAPRGARWANVIISARLAAQVCQRRDGCRTRAQSARAQRVEDREHHGCGPAPPTNIIKRLARSYTTFTTGCTFDLRRLRALDGARSLPLLGQFLANFSVVRSRIESRRVAGPSYNPLKNGQNTTC